MAERKSTSKKYEPRKNSKVKKSGKDTDTEKENERLVTGFAKRYHLPERCTDVIQALCCRADKSLQVQATSVSSDEGRKIVSDLNKIGYKKVSRALQRVVKIEEGEIVFHPRATLGQKVQAA